MRFALYAALLFAILPIVFARPFFGLCVYYVVSLMQPKLLCWRPDFQDALLVGVPLVVGAVAFGVKRAALEARRDPKTGEIIGVFKRFTRNPLFEPSWMLAMIVLLLAYITVTRPLVPFSMSHSTYHYRSLVKILFVVVLLTGLAADLRRFRVLYIVVAMATAFWAIKGGLKVILLGPHQVYGRTYDNNLFALMSVMTLPMIFYFGLSVKHARWRALLLIFSALMCLGIIGSRSRAGFVAFAVVLLCMAWSSRYRMRAVFAVGLVAVVAFTLSGQEVQQRIVSIIEYRTDKSAKSRFNTWKAAEHLLRDSPLIGVGFNNFEIAKDRYFGGAKAAHNVFLQNAAELGLLGHPIWLAIVLGSLISIYRFMRRTRGLPPDMRWAYYWSRGLALGQAAFCIHGMFHNEEYLELMFVMVGMNVALQSLTRRELVDRRLLGIVQQREAANPKPSPRRRSGRPSSHPGLMFERPRSRNLADCLVT